VARLRSNELGRGKLRAENSNLEDGKPLSLRLDK
jgi:hypothetical protein